MHDVITSRQYRLGQVPSDSYYVDPATGEGQWLTQFGDTVRDVLTGYAQYETAQKCLDLNLLRAQQNLPPIDCATYGTGVQVGVSPATQNMLFIIVAVLAGVYLLPKLLRR